MFRREPLVPKAAFSHLLSACQKAESCVAVTLRQMESATRCLLYPDTSACGPALQSSSATSSCKWVIREPAFQVYLRTGEGVTSPGSMVTFILLFSPVSYANLESLPLVTSISIPGYGTLQGAATEAALGSDRKAVVQFLGVPYARPPIGSLRFEEAQPADWTGTWDATKPR